MGRDGAGRTEGGICCDENALRLAILDQFVLGEVRVQPGYGCGSVRNSSVVSLTTCAGNSLDLVDGGDDLRRL